jgi:hypothetical protein
MSPERHEISCRENKFTTRTIDARNAVDERLDMELRVRTLPVLPLLPLFDPSIIMELSPLFTHIRALPIHISGF